MSVHVISVSVSFELALLSCLFCHFKKMNCILNTSFLNATSLKYNFLLNSFESSSFYKKQFHGGCVFSGSWSCSVRESSKLRGVPPATFCCCDGLPQPSPLTEGKVWEAYVPEGWVQDGRVEAWWLEQEAKGFYFQAKSKSRASKFRGHKSKPSKATPSDILLPTECQRGSAMKRSWPWSFILFWRLGAIKCFHLCLGRRLVKL